MPEHSFMVAVGKLRVIFCAELRVPSALHHRHGQVKLAVPVSIAACVTLTEGRRRFTPTRPEAEHDLTSGR